MTGTQSVVLGKTLAIILRSYFKGNLVVFDAVSVDWFNLVFILILFLSWFLCQGYWIYRYNDSMVKFDPTIQAPMNQVMWITFSTIAGGIYFKEFKHANYLQWLALFGGLILIYAGLFHLVPSINDRDANSDDLNGTIGKFNKKASKTSLKYSDLSNMDAKQLATMRSKYKRRRRKSKINNMNESNRKKIIHNSQTVDSIIDVNDSNNELFEQSKTMTRRQAKKIVINNKKKKRKRIDSNQTTMQKKNNQTKKKGNQKTNDMNNNV